MWYKIIFKLGQKLRNPSLNQQLQFLKTTEKWSLKELEAYQLQQLKKLVNNAFNHTPYYKNKLESLGITPSMITSLADLNKIPIITKEELITYNKELHSQQKLKKYVKATTSGTTGSTLNFKREEQADSFNRAAIFRGYTWYQVQPWERNGYFWGYNFSMFSQLKTKFLDALQNRFRLFKLQQQALQRFAKKLKKAHFLHGYSSLIYELAKYINTQQIEKPGLLKMVKGTSEKIYGTYQNEIEQAFGVKMISEYGAAETGIIAFECPNGNMHITMEGVIVEEWNHEIVVTNLQMQSFPIIRYRLGDYIKLAPKSKKCACGMQHRIIEEVTGRVGALVYGIKETYPSLYFYYIFKNLAKIHQLLLTYQVHQIKKGALTFLIEQTLTADELSILKNEIGNYFKNDIEITIKTAQTIIAENGKLKGFISTI